MKKNIKRIIPMLILFICISSIFIITLIHNSKKPTVGLKNINIEEILKTEAYSYLPEKAKNYIRETYENEGVIILTEKNKEENVEYLNPSYVEYLTNSEGYSTIPSTTVVDFVTGTFAASDDLPSSYDLTNVDGKNYITPWKNQGSEGLCWDFATNATIESFLLFTNGKEYDSTATILSEQQMDYATATDGVEVENYLYKNNRELSSGGFFETAQDILIDGLGTVPNTWDQAHSSQIKNKSTIERADIYNFNNSLYELNATYHIPTLDITTATPEQRQEYIDAIKTNIMQYGGAWVSTDMYGGNYNRYNGERIKVVDVRKGSEPFMHGYHALEIIGWDDNVEYTICKRSFNSDAPNDCGNGGYITGQGVWILKNSWGDSGRIVYLAYDSYKSDIFFIRDLGIKNWDNFYKTINKNIDSKTSTYSFKDNSYIVNEQLNKIKIDLPQNSTNTIYYSTNNGGNFKQLGEIQTTFQGFYNLDVASKNITVNHDLVFKIVTTASANSIKDFRVYTTNNSGSKSAKTEDINYDIENEKLNSSKYFDFYLYTQTKNVNNGYELEIKIKDSNGNYVSPSYYEFNYNFVYANINYGKLTIDSEHINKGHYTIETYYGGTDFATSELNINLDLIITQGDGSSSNPWKITNTRQFNAIRNYPNDSFKIMNDLDFEYDTRDENGLFYNNGYGFEAIPNYNGFIDGNGHQIKNLYSKTEINPNNNTEIRKGGIIDDVFIYNCKLDTCGFKNIIISNPEIIGAYNTGGFLNNVYVETTPQFLLENISVVGGSVSSLEEPTYVLGGVIGGFYCYAAEGDNIIVKNLFNSATVTGNSNQNKVFAEEIGGVVGTLNGDGEYGNIIFSNIINMGKISHSTYHSTVSNTINTTGGVMINIQLNNIIALDDEFPAIGIHEEMADYSDELNVSISNVYTTSQTAFNMTPVEPYLAENSNILENKSIYEIANADYSNWSNFTSNWTQYSEDGIKRIPIIKGVPFEYFTMENEVSIPANDSVDVLSLVTNVNYNDELNVIKTCSYELDICSNTTDDEIISVDGTTITGLKAGETSLIITNEHDGYINLLTVEVTDKKEITFNSNGGIGFMEKQSFTPGEQIQLISNMFTRDKYTFDHWNTKDDDSGESYEDGEKVTLDDSVTLYAIWKANSNYITFDANGGTGTMEPQEFKRGIFQSIKPATFTKEYHSFNHWNTKADDTGERYEDEENISIGEDMTLYAIYTINRFYILYELNGGSGLDDDKVDAGTIIERPEQDPVRNGYIFAGWYADEELTSPYEFGKPITQDVIIYAKWRQPIVTWDVNGGTPKSDFTSEEIHPVDYELTLPTQENLKVTPSEGYELDAYELEGARFLPGQSKVLKENIGIKIIWKEIVIPDPTEIYTVSFKKEDSSSETVPNGTNLTNYINNKKTEFTSTINDFKDGKENVTVDNYNDLFTKNSYVTFNKFNLKNTDHNEEENTITYEYEVSYNEVKVTVETLEKNEYKLEKDSEEEEKLDLGTDLEEYINSKKESFQKEVTDIETDDLFVIDKEKDIYQYPVFIEKELTNTEKDEENYIITNYYSYKYKLVNIILVEEYKLNNNDYTISFREKAGLEFKFDLLTSSSKPEEFNIDKIKELVKENGTLIDVLRITVSENDEELHEGPFEFRIKLTEDMKKYNKYYMIHISDDKKEEPIEFLRDGDYLVGTLKHLSDYALVGVEGENNPKTYDNIIGYILILTAISLIILGLRKKLHIRKFE